MAPPQGGKGGGGGGKKEHKNKLTSKKYAHYTIEGDKAKGTKSCIKCGPGVFLARHKDRLACGKCGYTEFSGEKKEEVAAPEKKEESMAAA